jgi:tRNA threonylcarbamoyladenosine modification (KEOPS) complex Cgi121 subunit
MPIPKNRILTRPASAESIPEYQKATREALESIGVGHGEQFVVFTLKETEALEAKLKEASGQDGLMKLRTDEKAGDSA